MTETERRASEAKRLLEEPLLREAFEAVEKAAYEEMLRLPTWRGDRKRRVLVDRINTIRDLRAHLTTQITLGTQSARKAPTVA